MTSADPHDISWEVIHLMLRINLKAESVHLENSEGNITKPMPGFYNVI